MKLDFSFPIALVRGENVTLHTTDVTSGQIWPNSGVILPVIWPDLAKLVLAISQEPVELERRAWARWKANKALYPFQYAI